MKDLFQKLMVALTLPKGSKYLLNDPELRDKPIINFLKIV